MNLVSFTEIGKIHTKIYKKWYSLTFSGNPSWVWVADCCMSDYPGIYSVILLFVFTWVEKMTCWARYKATSHANTNNIDLFPSQVRNIWNKYLYLIPTLYQSPAFECRIPADYRQNASARTDGANSQDYWSVINMMIGHRYDLSS